MKKLNSFQIKIILLILMLFDHIWSYFPNLFPSWIHAISRGVGPMFGYFLVEGFHYTSNKFKYGLRLFLFSIFMQLGNLLLNKLIISKNIIISNNIFFTLFISFIIISLLDYIKNFKGFKKYILISINIFISTIGIFSTEGGFSVIPFVIITYYFKENSKKLFLGYFILSLTLFMIQGVQIYETFKETYEMFMFNSDFLLFLSIPFILLYNGERGLTNKFSKYLFYIFYPLHLWILILIKFFTK